MSWIGLVKYYIYYINCQIYVLDLWYETVDENIIKSGMHMLNQSESGIFTFKFYFIYSLLSISYYIVHYCQNRRK